MRNFPDSMIETTKDEDFWKDCEDLLHVTSANDIKDPVFGQKLQHTIQDRLDKAVKDKKIKTADFTEHARQLHVSRLAGRRLFQTQWPSRSSLPQARF